MTIKTQIVILRIEMSTDPQNPSINGATVIFHWHGKIPPYVSGDFNQWDELNGLEFKQVKPLVWQAELNLPRNAYMEYAFFRDGNRIPDPLNRRSLSNGVGSRNHYFYMPEATPSRYAQLHRKMGTLIESQISDSRGLIGGKRKVYFYQPAASGPMPLLVVLDGSDYLRRGRILQIVDSLIAAGKIRPVALAMIENAGSGRFVEYACNDAFVFIMENRLIPAACEQLPVIDPRKEPGSWGILGASMGGTMAMFSGLRAPHIFSTVLAQSSAFSTPFADFTIIPLIKSLKPAFNVWMDVGTFDFLLEDNRRVLPLLRQAGYSVGYSEGCGGHNFTYWRNALPAGLQYLYPPLD